MILIFIVVAVASTSNFAVEAQGEDPRKDVSHFEYVDVQIEEKLGRDGSVIINFGAFGQNHTIHADRDVSMFKETYQEVVLGVDGKLSVVKTGPPDCIYSGKAHWLDISEPGTPVAAELENAEITGSELSGMAHLSLCGEGLHALVRHHDRTFEVHYLKEERKHIAYDLDHYSTDEDIGCGAPHHHTHHHHHHHYHYHNDNNEGHPSQPTRSRHHQHSHQAHKGSNDSSTSPPLKYHSHFEEHDTVTALEAGECDANPDKFVDVLMINDFFRYSQRGEDTEAHSTLLFNYLNAFISGGNIGGYTFPGLTSPQFNCRVSLRLVGQLTWRAGIPVDMQYFGGSNCGENCGKTDTCAGDEISSDCLLSSMRTYTRNSKSSLEAIFGEIDNLPLLSGASFNGGIIGSAFIGGMCSTDGNSVSVNEILSSSAAFSSAILAHELGHNFGMQHDPEDEPGFVMNTFASPQIATQYSPSSIAGISTFMEDQYGEITPRCLENDSGPEKYRTPICGNARLDEGETCDPGVDNILNDPCCTSTCQLAPGCSCSVFDPCCTASGTFQEAGYVCRQATDPICDVEEQCTGTSSSCPSDFYALPGVTCTYDQLPGGASEDGMCFRGHCVGRSSSCTSSNLPYQFGPDVNICTEVLCRDCLDNNCTEGFSFDKFPAQAGTPCGEAHQCLPASEQAGSACVASDMLREYRYEVRDCANVVCIDTTGLIVDETRCEEDPPSIPANCSLPPGQTTFFPAATLSPFSFPPADAIPIPSPSPPPASNGSNESPFRVTCTLAISFDQVTPYLMNNVRTGVMKAILATQNQFLLSFKPGSVILAVTFDKVSQTPSPETLAMTLSGFTHLELSAFMQTSVLSCGSPTALGVAGESSSGDSGSGGDIFLSSSGQITGVGIALIVVITVCGLLIAVCCIRCCCYTPPQAIKKSFERIKSMSVRAPSVNISRPVSGVIKPSFETRKERLHSVARRSSLNPQTLGPRGTF